MEKRNPSAPYSVDDAKKERSRVLAHKRRATNRSVMDELTKVLPLPKDVVTHLDYSSKLRLALCFFRLKSLTGTVKSEEEEAELSSEGPSQSTDVVSTTTQKHPALFNLGMVQDLMMEALDGFLLVLSSDGVVIYISESVHHHLGIFQSEHIGISIYDMINEEDQKEVREAMLNAETKAISFRGTEVSFFCRMKCSRFKLSNNVNKNPGHKLVYVSGRMKLMGRDQYLVAVVRPVSPPSVVELRIEANMFVTQYDLQMSCTFFDGRLKHLLGYSKGDLEGQSPFGLQHHEDLGATAKCGEGIMSRGEGLSGYYRFMCRGGFYVWIQTRGMLMHDSRTGKATHIVCMNYIISKEDGDRDLRIRQAITDSAIPHQKGVNQSYDPFPLNEREDGAKVNPLKETSWGHKENVEMQDVFVKEHSHLTEKEKDDVVVKQEIPSSVETSSAANSCDLTNSPVDGSPADSGLHSNTSHNSASAFSSTSSIFASSNKSASFKQSSSVVEHCLPDSTTGSEGTGVVGKGSSNQLVSESIVCWDSPPNKVGGSDYNSTPPSVFSSNNTAHHANRDHPSFPSDSSPPLIEADLASQTQYRNGSDPKPSYPVSAGEFRQAATGSTVFMPHTQGLETSMPAQYLPQDPLGYVQTGTPGFNGGSGKSQPSSGSDHGQLYQLLSKQPPQGQLGAVAVGNTVPSNLAGFTNGDVNSHAIPCNSAGFSNGSAISGHAVPGNLAEFSNGSAIPSNLGGFSNGGYHGISMNSGNPHYSDPASSAITNRLPAWTGMETEVHIHSVPQQHLPAGQFSAKQYGYGNSSAGSAQQASHIDTLPQLTDEDMRILDCFNETPTIT